MRIIPLSVAMSLVVLVPAQRPAAADDDADKNAAREAFDDGLAHYEAKRYEEALAAFRLANGIFPSWKLHFNIGQCEAALKRYGLAMDQFERYMAEGGDDVKAERAEYVVEELRRLKELVGTVEVEGPDGLVVLVDGLERGTTPLGTGIRVTAGRDLEVEVLKDGKTVLERVVTVGGTQNVLIETDGEVLEPEDEPEAPEPEPEEQGDEGPAATEDEGEGLSPVYFWIGAGTTVAFGGVALAMSFVAESKYDDAVADPADQSIRDEGETVQAVGITFLALTGAAALTTGILAAFTDFGGEEPGAEVDVAVAPWASGDGGGLALEGRF